MKLSSISVIVMTCNATDRKELQDHVDSVFLGEVEGRSQRILQDLQNNNLAPVYDYQADFPPIECIGPARRSILNHDRYVYRGVRMLDLVHASLGCRFNCFPCCTPFLGGRQFRPRPIDKVVEELEGIDNNRIFLVDNSFAQDTEWTKDLFRAIAPLKNKWISHPIRMDDELLDLAAAAGCWYVYQAVFDTSDHIRNVITSLKDSIVFQCPGAEITNNLFVVDDENGRFLQLLQQLSLFASFQAHGASAVKSCIRALALGQCSSYTFRTRSATLLKAEVSFSG